MNFPFLIIPMAISAAGVVGSASFAIYRNSKERTLRREVIENETQDYPTASAGTPSVHVPATATSIPLKYTQFRNSDNQVLIPDEFLHYVVEGNSMQFCGIKDKDLIFVKKGFKAEDLFEFPKVIVIKRDNAPKEETQYKVRRSWRVCQFNQCLDQVREIVNSPNFRERIASIKYYDGPDKLIADFKGRLDTYYKKYIKDVAETGGNKKYETVVISTTFHTDCKKIRFSVHPLCLVKGIVVASFTV